MSVGGWVGGIIVVAGLIAFATKPNEAAMKAAADSLFATARENTWNKGDYLNWAQIAIGDNIRSGKYEDQLLISKYTVTLGNTPIIECYGILGQTSCSRADDKTS